MNSQQSIVFSKGVHKVATPEGTVSLIIPKDVTLREFVAAISRTMKGGIDEPKA